MNHRTCQSSNNCRLATLTRHTRCASRHEQLDATTQDCALLGYELQIHHAIPVLTPTTDSDALLGLVYIDLNLSPYRPRACGLPAQIH